MNPVNRAITQQIPNLHATNYAKFNIAANALTYGLSAGGQAMGVFHNPKVSEDEKWFICRQEVYKGILDLATMIFLSSKFMQFGEELVKQGKRLPTSIDGVAKNKEAIKKTIKNFYNTGAEGKDKVIKEIGEKGASQIVKHMNSTKMATSLLGTIVAFNFVTPLTKNVMAKYMTKGKSGNNMPASNIQKKFESFMKNPAGKA